VKKLLGLLYDVVFAYTDICEIRLNLNRPVEVVTLGQVHRLSVVCTQTHLDHCLAVATDYSVYTAVSRMVQGYLPYVGGVRIGLAGRYCIEGQALHHMQSLTGMVIRLPHEVAGCSAVLPLDRVYGRNILVTSPPFGGKTTFIRDLAARLSHRCHVVVIDEREELCGGGRLSVGECLAVSGAPKQLVYSGVVRALNPTYVVTDELDLPRDLEVVRSLSCAGIRVVATVHGDRRTLSDSALCALFDIRVLLGVLPQVGHVEEVVYA
jgi:stage III sporulation protein AA